MERRAIHVRGIVQGVGFRPFVYGLATKLNLSGFVANQSGSVRIEVEGEPARVSEFVEELSRHPPPLAKIEDVSWETKPPLGDREFRIEPSRFDGPHQVFISPDIATCEDCLRELFDPSDRRFGYPFSNCTNCGPRLTVITGAPYDRPRTTMAQFAMCAACRKEYEDPHDRRFHAEPIACADCGPRLALHDTHGKSIGADSPLDRFAQEIRSGKIGALKGIGGFHLVCDARNEKAVAELRARKHRDEKPFAIIAPNFAAIEAICEIDALEQALLQPPRCPIVLLRKRANNAIAEGVAPGNPFLGVMLPYAPLHHLLCRAVDGIPLVMTSGNRSDEPIAYENDDAFERLHGIADVFLTHDRPIHVRCDDSVTRVVAGVESPLRRSRGYAPFPISLPIECACPILAVGGQLKSTFALGEGHHAFVSHHLGDLDHFATMQAFEKDVSLYERLFALQLQRIAHDLHPDYAATRYALARAVGNPVELVAVQHHHAHLASCMAEHGLNERVIGVIFDGTGFGTDGAIWGGEFLVGDYHGFERAAHLRYVPMPGGDQAIREPWRMALSHANDAGVSCTALASRPPAAAWRVVARMLEQRWNSPPTSSAGRLFDAVAALAGIRDRVSYEGQAAMELEWQATVVADDASYPFEFEQDASPGPIVIDTRPLIRAVTADVEQGVAAATIARRFHSTIVEMIVVTCRRIRSRTSLGRVVMSGGVFMNALLAREATLRLSQDGFKVHRHRLVPPNDGGLSLGQLSIAAIRNGKCDSA